jgi:hypothetical protein
MIFMRLPYPSSRLLVNSESWQKSLRIPSEGLCKVIEASGRGALGNMAPTQPYFGV